MATALSLARRRSLERALGGYGHVEGVVTLTVATPIIAAKMAYENISFARHH